MFKSWNRNLKLSVRYSNHLPWTHPYYFLFTVFFMITTSISWKFLNFCFTSFIIFFMFMYMDNVLLLPNIISKTVHIKLFQSYVLQLAYTVVFSYSNCLVRTTGFSINSVLSLQGDTPTFVLKFVLAWKLTGLLHQLLTGKWL